MWRSSLCGNLQTETATRIAELLATNQTIHHLLNLRQICATLTRFQVGDQGADCSLHTGLRFGRKKLLYCILIYELCTGVPLWHRQYTRCVQMPATIIRTCRRGLLFTPPSLASITSCHREAHPCSAFHIVRLSAASLWLCGPDSSAMPYL